MRNNQSWHPRLVHANSQAVAGYARLSYFEYRLPNLVPVTNADLVIRKSFNSEIFSKLSKAKIIASKDPLPVSVRIDLVDEDCALLTPMARQISLRITIDIQLANHPSSLHGKLPDR